MERKKRFLSKVKDAIFNFDEYQNFATEKSSECIKYLLILILICSIVMTCIFTYTFKDIKDLYSEELGEYFNQEEIENEYLAIANNKGLFIILFGIAMYSVNTIITIIDILYITVFGYLLSRMMRLKLKFKVVFNIAIYAITLPIILNSIYVIINRLTGFTIEYFSIAYDLIAYIYIITAIIIIKSNLIKQQTELMKIIQEQENVRKEQEEKENNEENEDKKGKNEDEDNENEEER